MHPSLATQLGRLRKRHVRPLRRARILHLLESHPCGRVLDAPAGSLWLARALASRGFAVDAIDLSPHVDHGVALPGAIHALRGDLDEGLAQFADRTFDYVVSVEGLEHLERPALAVREFGRVLKPCGLLLVTTPNVVSLRSRIKFLLFGYYDGFRRRALFRHLATSPGEETPHVMPLHPQFLYYWLARAGFVGIRAHDIRVRRWERFLLLPLALVVAGVRCFAHREPDEPHYEAYLRLLSSRAVLFSPTLVVTARKSDPAERWSAGRAEPLP
jgi:SAM-dependent methyltransferase